MDEDTLVATAPVEAPPSDDSAIFNDIIDESDGDESSSPPPSPEPEGTPAATTPDSSVGVPAPAAVTPVAEVATPTPPVVTQTPAPAPAPAVAPVAQPAAAPTPSGEEAGRALAQQRENLVTEIAARYAMPEDVKNEFLMNPEKVLPQFAARLYVDVFDAILNTVMQQVPQLMVHREHQMVAQRQVEDKFFQRWPGLKDPQYHQDIMAVGRSYRQANPQATPEQMLEAIGAMVSVMKGVPLPGQSATPPSAPPMRPPVPVGSGASRTPVPPATQENFSWYDLVKEDN